MSETKRRVVTVYLRGAFERHPSQGPRWNDELVEAINVLSDADLLFDEAGIVIQSGGDTFGGYRSKRHLPWWRVIEVTQDVVSS